MGTKEFLKKLVLYFSVVIILVIALVVIVDPFFHYHKPFFGLSPVQWKMEYQVNGALDHLDYDALLVGSSVVMNMDNNILDDAYDCESIKAVASGATTDTLYYYINRAYKSHDLKYVFYGIDYGVLSDEFVDDSKQNQVLYLRNKNPFDDIEYILNEDVIFHYIPDMIIQSMKGYDDGLAYNFARYSKFGARETIDRYIEEYGERTFGDDDVLVDLEDMSTGDDDLIVGEEVSNNVKINVNHIEELVTSHPETQYVFFFPVRSILSYDRAVDGLENDFAIIRYVVNTLNQYDNVIFYLGLFNDEESVMNLDNYCDWTHASYEVNCETARRLVEGSAVINSDNVEEQLEVLRRIIIEFEKRLQEEKSYEFLVGMY